MMFLGLPDPDPLLRDTDPDPDPEGRETYGSCGSGTESLVPAYLLVNFCTIRYEILFHAL
jgi:hypothetical protein